MMKNEKIKFKAYKQNDETGNISSNIFTLELSDGSIKLKDYIDISRCPVFAFVRYIGSEDRKGKEIYEGDIIEQGIPNRYRGVVTFTDDMMFCIKNAKNDYSFINNNIADVIGNIYENPELLKPEKKMNSEIENR